MRVLGLDIGGANLKAATADGESISMSLPMWKDRELLHSALQELSLLKEFTPDIVALSMTAELADCFLTKAEGVGFVINAVVRRFPDSLVRVWLTSGEFAAAEDALEVPELAAASNWHALATWAGRAVPTGPALLIDVGSTTTDIVPLIDGLPVPEGRTDLERLSSFELRYTGVRRTPVCAMVRSVPLLNVSGMKADGLDEGSCCEIPVAAELFATSLDVHLITGDITPNEQDTDTADGRPATRQAALNRLAHMLCCDMSEVSESQLCHIAGYVADQQVAIISEAISNRSRYLQEYGIGALVASKGIQVLISGSGAWLAERAIQELDDVSIASVSKLSDMFVRNVSSCAPAFAIARLAVDRCLDDLLPTIPF